ncbi:hypothetical protein predicted by Glimmer/Critica [Bacteroides ovatus V975]|jgi:hypothetical protein|uniref:Uncharacterized protein n=1 Tax=Bacteroides ovatus (strain ATCC 8483 / DSM 1896 / JCM 5824 / BCRC 10623 / CCUG 4943 / NCTC 11153) TaxID=411476 RepID=A0AAN3D3Y3_BACO1|nr:hypothetical protein BACOVA_04667 [Bacteroides ovatus ATCC 8483]SCV08166.1 hypothetical protein predicted by Glimmer/Critica [Bacteroides ovatus V975]
MVSPLSKKEGWLKAGVVGINKVYPSMKKEIHFFTYHLPLRGLTPSDSPVIGGEQPS